MTTIYLELQKLRRDISNLRYTFAVSRQLLNLHDTEQLPMLCYPVASLFEMTHRK